MQSVRHVRGTTVPARPALTTLVVLVSRAGQILLAPSTEELVLELAILAVESFDFGFEFPFAFDGPGVHRLPVPDLLAEIEVVALQVNDFLAELANFATRLL